MSNYDSADDTIEHILEVRANIYEVSKNLSVRAINHDAPKLTSLEKEAFDRETPLLRELTYGSDEYKAATARLGEALKHHYQNNSHHPEHYDNGINGMSLLDLMEMLADWKAAVKRHKDGDLAKSLEINRERHGISEQLYEVLKNTLVELSWLEKEGGKVDE